MSSSVLAEIVARKRIDVAARLGDATLEDMIAGTEPTSRSLARALARPGARFIMEIKRASPSVGAIRGGADAAAIASAYTGAADAISVLTDGPYFCGHLNDIAEVRSAFNGPILCKDFTIDPRQVAEARAHGADAVLVMLSVLDDAEAAACLRVADRLGMDALVEAHDETEVRRAVALGARVIGINNRDLRDLSIDLAVTERLAHLVPTDRVLISESGITTRADTARLAPHVDAFLVGSSLMSAPDPAAAARALAYGRVKVCGLTNGPDIAAARRAGACFAGLIMVPGTPRAVSSDLANELANGANMPIVGVFRDAPLAQVAALARNANVAAVQLHGQEDANYISDLAANLPPECEVWAATSIGETVPTPRPGATRTLFDTGPGGTGRAFDWSLLADRGDLSQGILAGGLDPTNAAAASRVGAWALDIGSGVESAPGRKDPAKLAALFGALRLPTSRAGLSYTNRTRHSGTAGQLHAHVDDGPQPAAATSPMREVREVSPRLPSVTGLPSC